MTIRMLLATAATLALLGSGATYAQAPASDKPAAAAKAKPARTAKSLECSKQADEKNMHGKPRQRAGKEVGEGGEKGRRVRGCRGAAAGSRTGSSGGELPRQTTCWSGRT